MSEELDDLVNRLREEAPLMRYTVQMLVHSAANELEAAGCEVEYLRQRLAAAEAERDRLLEKNKQLSRLVSIASGCIECE